MAAKRATGRCRKFRSFRETSNNTVICKQTCSFLRAQENIIYIYTYVFTHICDTCLHLPRKAKSQSKAKAQEAAGAQKAELADSESSVEELQKYLQAPRIEKTKSIRTDGPSIRAGRTCGAWVKIGGATPPPKNKLRIK